MLKEYYKLTKPGIVYGNLFTTLAGFFFAAGWQVPGTILPYAAQVFIATTLGLGFIIGSACVFNNIFDRKIDSKMERTKNRPLVTGTISVRDAYAFGTALGLVGLVFLICFVNLLTAGIALFGWLSYVLIYTFAKRHSWVGVYIGSIPGAIPIVVGYTAVTGQFDLPALILFLILVVWQMPHFYAIALYRFDEYKAAGIPTLAHARGALATKIQIVLFILFFILFTISLSYFGYAGYIYAVILLAVGLAWLWRACQGFRKGIDQVQWAKGLFLFSLVVLVVFSVTLAVSPLLP